MVKLIKAEFDGSIIQFNDLGWFNATLVSKKFNKDLSNFFRLPSTIEYSDALKSKYVNITDLTHTKRGNNGGTWVHPKLGVLFARWCDVNFSIWCDEQIEEIIHGKPESQDWRKLRHEAASSYKVMSDVLHDVRNDIGKETKSFHYANEAKLVNWSITGEFKAIDRDALNQNELDTLAKLETRNSVMIAKGVSREDRKEILSGMASKMLDKQYLKLAQK